MTASTTDRTATLTFFAAAAEAAGTGTMNVALHAGDSYRDVLGRAAEGNEDLRRVVGCAAVFADGELIRDLDREATTAAIDVLPPFAGG